MYMVHSGLEYVSMHQETDNLVIVISLAQVVSFEVTVVRLTENGWPY